MQFDAPLHRRGVGFHFPPVSPTVCGVGPPVNPTACAHFLCFEITDEYQIFQFVAGSVPVTVQFIGNFRGGKRFAPIGGLLENRQHVVGSDPWLAPGHYCRHTHLGKGRSESGDLNVFGDMNARYQGI